jgi:hypothetical protein
MKDITYKNLRVVFHCDIHGKKRRFGYNLDNFPLTIFTQIKKRVFVRSNIIDRMIKEIASKSNSFPYESLKYYLSEIVISQKKNLTLS